METNEIRSFALLYYRSGQQNAYNLYTYSKTGELYRVALCLERTKLADRAVIAEKTKLHGTKLALRSGEFDTHELNAALNLMEFLLEWDITETYEQGYFDPEILYRSWKAPNMWSYALSTEQPFGIAKAEWERVNKTPPTEQICSDESTNEAPKKCTCDMTIIMSVGCQCGGI